MNTDSGGNLELLCGAFTEQSVWSTNSLVSVCDWVHPSRYTGQLLAWYIPVSLIFVTLLCSSMNAENWLHSSLSHLNKLLYNLQSSINYTSHLTRVTGVAVVYYNIHEAKDKETPWTDHSGINTWHGYNLGTPLVSYTQILHFIVSTVAQILASRC